MVAFTIVVLVLLSLLGAISFGLQGVGAADGRQNATFEANRLLELIRQRQLAQSLGFNDAPSARVPIEAAPFTSDFPANSGLTRRIVTDRLSDDPDHYQYKVFSIEVTVFWKTRGRESSVTLESLTRAL
jgi:hypothetical protein